MPDYGVFWISVLGVLNIAVVLGSIALGVDRRQSVQPSRIAWVTGAGAVMCIGAALLGINRLRLSEIRSHEAVQGDAAIEALTGQLVAVIDDRHLRKPRIHIADFDWGVAAGVLLQLRKMNVPFAVDMSHIRFFGQPVMARGDEDALLTFCGPQLHRRLVERPDNVMFAEFGSSFIDGIPLPIDNGAP